MSRCALVGSLARTLIATTLITSCAERKAAIDAAPPRAVSDAAMGAMAPVAPPAQQPLANADPVALAEIELQTDAGPLYLLVANRGFVRLDGRRVTAVLKKRVYDLAIGDGDIVYAAVDDGIYRIEKGKPDRLSPRVFDSVALSPSGELWALAGLVAARWTGRKWQDEARPTFTDDPGVARDLEFAADGALYLVAARKIFIKQDGASAWQPANSPVESASVLYKTAIRRGDVLYIAHGTGMLRASEGQLVPVVMPGNHFYSSRFALLGDGRIVAAGKKKAVIGSPLGDRHYLSVKDLVHRGKSVGAKIVAIAGDARGRIWLSTELGLVVVQKPPGKEASVQARFDSKALGGRVDKIWAVRGGPPPRK